MVKSMYAGITGLQSHQAKMDVIGNNIANVNTYGYKSSRVTFKDVFYQTMSSSSSGSTTIGGTNASQVGYGTSVGSIDVLHTRSGFAPTGRSSDLMIDGEGYFILGPIGGVDDDGNPIKNLVPADNLSSTVLTRVGTFEYDANGNLTSKNGSGVYGYDITGYDEDGPVYGEVDGVKNLSPIKYPKYEDIIDSLPDGTEFDPELMDQLIMPSSVNFGANGKITGTVQDSAGNAHIIELGQLAVASVPNPNGLEMAGGSEFRLGGNAGNATAFIPGEGPTATLRSGGLEMSNVDISQEFADMILTQRGFQANSKIITVTDEMLAELVNMK